MKPELSYSSVAEDKKHVRLVTALKSHSLNLCSGPRLSGQHPSRRLSTF
jgi:hypothetical protein